MHVTLHVLGVEVLSLAVGRGRPDELSPRPALEAGSAPGQFERAAELPAYSGDVVGYGFRR